MQDCLLAQFPSLGGLTKDARRSRVVRLSDKAQRDSRDMRNFCVPANERRLVCRPPKATTLRFVPSHLTVAEP